MSRLRHLLLLVGFCLMPMGLFAAPASVFLEDLTWTELRQRIRSGTTTIILPIGGVEQSGPAMALGKHDTRVRLLSERIARELGNALVAPVLAYVPEGGVNPPTEHMRFPGTITLPDQAFETVLEYAARSFRLHGFRDIVFLGDHGGYQADEKQVADKLDLEWKKSPVRVHAVLVYYTTTLADYVQALKSRGYSDAEIGTHAGLADTSLTLALAPDLVRADRLASDSGLTPANGVYGDPRRSTAALGELGVDLIVAKTVAAIRKTEAER